MSCNIFNIFILRKLFFDPSDQGSLACHLQKLFQWIPVWLYSMDPSDFNSKSFLSQPTLQNSKVLGQKSQCYSNFSKCLLQQIQKKSRHMPKWHQLFVVSGQDFNPNSKLLKCCSSITCSHKQNHKAYMSIIRKEIKISKRSREISVASQVFSYTCKTNSSIYKYSSSKQTCLIWSSNFTVDPTKFICYNNKKIIESKRPIV